MTDLINVKQLANYLKISPKTIYNMVCLGKIPYVKAGGALRFDWKDIQEWLRPNISSHAKLKKDITPSTEH